ncbi:MAG: Uma2 family endonuclease [Armatimonadaceae bacterium]
MSILPKYPGDREIHYPDSDGQPMADNTLQFQYIVMIKEGLEALFADNPEVFVAGDLLWYPVEGHPEIRVAPDVLVAFGRPKGYRGSYRQWEENDVVPQVVFEILSPGITLREMARKFDFYERCGVEEYYLYDPERLDWSGWIREDNQLRPLGEATDWKSPRLGIRFAMDASEGLILYRPDGERFKTFTEIMAERNQARSERDSALQERDSALQEKDAALRQRDEERERADRLAARLRELGIEPE